MRTTNLSAGIPTNSISHLMIYAVFRKNKFRNKNFYVVVLQYQLQSNLKERLQVQQRLIKNERIIW